MRSIEKVGKYVVICLVGIALALVVALLEYDAKDLSASVLSITEKDFFESTQRGAGYKKQNNIFEVFLSEQVRNEGVLTVSILYNPSEIKWFIDEMKNNCSVDNISQTEGNLVLDIDGYENLDFSEGVFEIPYSGNSMDLTLEYVKSKDEMFSIGNLDDITDVEKH